jgi:hypothetical protein
VLLYNGIIVVVGENALRPAWSLFVAIGPIDINE